MLIALNKPYGVLCQFSASGTRRTLKDLLDVPRVYAAGRLDLDSEGLVLLTDDGRLQHRIASPSTKLPKRYWVEVEGVPDDQALRRLISGVDLGEFRSRCQDVHRMAVPEAIWPRVPPIRTRLSVPTSWLEIVLVEGKNRQVRRSTAAIGHPTLRLIRWAIGPVTLGNLGLAPGQWLPIQARDLRLERNPAAQISATEIPERRQPHRGSRR